MKLSSRGVRVLALLAAVAVASTTALASCGLTDPEPSVSATPGAELSTDVGSAGPFPEAAGGFGESPTLTFPDEAPADTLQVTELTAGEGAQVAAGDLLVVDYHGQIWGGSVFDSSYQRGAPAAFPIGNGSVIQGWDLALVGRTVGSRVLISIPPHLGYGSSGNSGAGISGTDTLVFVVDVVGSYGADAAGQPDADATGESAGVGPEISGELGGPATISVPEGTPEPTEFSAALVGRGTGAPVAPGQLVVQFAATFWDNSGGQSTWEQGGPIAIDVSVAPFDALVGMPIGSRVLVAMPAAGDAPAYAVVIDVLGQLDRA